MLIKEADLERSVKNSASSLNLRAVCVKDVWQAARNESQSREGAPTRREDWEDTDMAEMLKERRTESKKNKINEGSMIALRIYLDYLDGPWLPSQASLQKGGRRRADKEERKQSHDPSTEGSEEAALRALKTEEGAVSQRAQVVTRSRKRQRRQV